MKTKRALGWLLAASLGALAVPSMIGCGGVVTVGGGTGGQGGDSGSGGDGQGGGITDPGAGGAGGCDPGCPGPEAIAMTWAQVEAAQGGSSSSGTTVTTGGGPDPNTQFLMYGGGTELPTCSAPYGIGNGECGGWNAHIFIAPALFQVGVIPFSDPGLDISVMESVDEGNGQCSGGGGGGFEEGQLEILEITPTTVHFVVSGVSAFFNDDPNGERVAARCP
jgi:hypothetical protein